jgi:hypothetical protein
VTEMGDTVPSDLNSEGRYKGHDTSKRPGSGSNTSPWQRATGQRKRDTYPGTAPPPPPPPSPLPQSASVTHTLCTVGGAGSLSLVVGTVQIFGTGDVMQRPLA